VLETGPADADTTRRQAAALRQVAAAETQQIQVLELLAAFREQALAVGACNEHFERVRAEIVCDERALEAAWEGLEIGRWDGELVGWEVDGRGCGE